MAENGLRVHAGNPLSPTRLKKCPQNWMTLRDWPLLKLLKLVMVAMPFSTSPEAPNFIPSQPLPQHLDHKPVFALPYEAFDGPYAGKTDVQYISLGIAQYDPDETSIKTMRYTGTKWTRQAEELPLHRPIDMTLFLAKAVFDSEGGVVGIPTETFDRQTSDITVTREQRNFGENASFEAAVAKIKPSLKKRLNTLLQVLNDLKRDGKI